MTPEGVVMETFLQIADKEGTNVDFKLNSAQRSLDQAISESGTMRMLVPKARQEGVSSYFLARGLIRCLQKENTRAVVISHDEESTKRMLTKVKYYIDMMKTPERVKLDASASNRLSFPAKKSEFYIGTAGSRKFGRGDTIHYLHCSEYAYWKDPANLMAGLFQAVPKSGEIFIESTGNGYNDYHSRCMRASAGISDWGCHFLPWHTFDEYSLPISKAQRDALLGSLDEEMEEDLLTEILTPGQLAWRRVKLEEMDYDLGLFKQEYPMSLDECFRASGESLFQRVRMVPTTRWVRVEKGYWELEGHPRLDLHYVLGADVASGVGKDSSVIEVICLETMEQVAEYRNNRLQPDIFAEKIAEIGERFGNAMAVVEQNNHGLLTVSELRKGPYPNNAIWGEVNAAAQRGEEGRLMKTGFKTTVRSKPLMIGRLRKLLASDLAIHSPILKGELSTFIEHEGGKLEAQAGCHDDTVMAMACAVVGMGRAALRAESAQRRDASYAKRVDKADPSSVAAAIEQLKGRGKKFGFRAQNDSKAVH